MKKKLILLHIIFFMYSLIGVLYKLASEEKMFSGEFFLLYVGLLFLLFVYAIVWQQILKKMSLTIAYLNKAVVIIWGLIWGWIIFDEKITWNMMVGAIIVFLGVSVVSSDEK